MSEHDQLVRDLSRHLADRLYKVMQDFNDLAPEDLYSTVVSDAMSILFGKISFAAEADNPMRARQRLLMATLSCAYGPSSEMTSRRMMMVIELVAILTDDPGFGQREFPQILEAARGR